MGIQALIIRARCRTLPWHVVRKGLQVKHAFNHTDLSFSSCKALPNRECAKVLFRDRSHEARQHRRLMYKSTVSPLHR